MNAMMNKLDEERRDDIVSHKIELAWTGLSAGQTAFALIISQISGSLLFRYFFGSLKRLRINGRLWVISCRSVRAIGSRRTQWSLFIVSP